MKKILTFITTNLLLISLSLSQSLDQNVLIEKIVNKNIRTSTYHSIEFSEEGEEVSESMGYSDDVWELTRKKQKLTLTLKNQGELMETYNISVTRISEEGTLLLQSEEKKISFWFYENYLLTKSDLETSTEIAQLLGYNSTWFYYN